MDRPKLDTLFLAYRASGDAAALAQVFDLAAPELYELARRLAPDRSAAEDLLQDTFVAAIEKRSSWDTNEPLMPWLIGILAIASQRRRRERARTPDPQRVTQAPVERPDEALEASERQGQLLAALAALKPEERSLVEQRLLEGCSPREMARELGLSSSTLRMRLSRALARLRRSAPSSLSWAFFPSWSARKAVLSVRLRLLPGVPVSAPAVAPVALAASLLGVALVAGTIGIVACLSPEKHPPVAVQNQPLASSQPSAKLESAPIAKGAQAAKGADGASEQSAVPPAPKVVTIGAPPAEGEIAALLPAPDAPRKRLHVIVQKDGRPLERAELIRQFPDAGYEGYWPQSDALGRIEADIIVAQPALKLCIQADGCTRQEFELDPATLKDGDTRRIDMRPGPLAVKVRFVHPCKFPQGFAVCFLSLGLLGDRRPEPAEIQRDFLAVLNHIDSRITPLRPDGTAEVPILPGRYWVWANPNNRPSGEWLEFPSCCFEVVVPEGHDAEIFYAGTLGGALMLDVLGPATIGMDVSVTLEDGSEAPRTLTFQTSNDKSGASYSNSINVGTLGCRSEPIPPGEHVLVFHQRGKEIDRRKVTIVRGEELKLSITP